MSTQRTNRDIDDGMSNAIGNITASLRCSYDALACAYARRFSNELESKPADRELLNRFANEVGPAGKVCDIGCGPGHVARYLRDAGLHVFGIDVSPVMIEQAKRLNPGIAFQVGDMTALDVSDESLAGLVAFYAIVNTPRKALPVVFGEMWRVLEPKGLILLSFHIGDDTLHVEELLGENVSLDFFFFQPLDIVSELKQIGFSNIECCEREPYDPEIEYQSRRAYVFAQKPRRS